MEFRISFCPLIIFTFQIQYDMPPNYSVSSPGDESFLPLTQNIIASVVVVKSRAVVVPCVSLAGPGAPISGPGATAWTPDVRPHSGSFPGFRPPGPALLLDGFAQFDGGTCVAGTASVTATVRSTGSSSFRGSHTLLTAAS